MRREMKELRLLKEASEMKLREEAKYVLYTSPVRSGRSHSSV